MSGNPQAPKRPSTPEFQRVPEKTDNQSTKQTETPANPRGGRPLGGCPACGLG